MFALAMSSMLFCPRCANILPLRADAGQLAFACATCPYQFTVQSDMEYRTMGKKRAVAQVEGQQTEGQYDATGTPSPRPRPASPRFRFPNSRLF